MLRIGMEDKIHGIFPYLPQHPNSAGEGYGKVSGKNSVFRNDCTILFHQIVENNPQKAEHDTGKGVNDFVVEGKTPVSAKGNADDKGQEAEDVNCQGNQIGGLKTGQLPEKRRDEQK